MMRRSAYVVECLACVTTRTKAAVYPSIIAKGQIIAKGGVSGWTMPQPPPRRTIDRDANRLRDVLSASLRVCADDGPPSFNNSQMKIFIQSSVLWKCRAGYINELSPPDHILTLPTSSYNNQLNVFDCRLYRIDSLIGA